jgi:hypothetical protein
MQKLKITKTIEEMPIEKVLNLCLQVLKRPKEISQEDWVNRIRKDLITGKKFLKIRELVLSKRNYST